MKPTLIVFAVVALAVGALLWGNARSPAGTDVNTARATGLTAAAFSDPVPTYDFGPVSMANGNVAREFALTNSADTALAITGAETSCMCTEAMLLLPDGTTQGPFGMPGHGSRKAVNVLLAPGEVLTVRTIFDPAAHGPAGIGPVERAVILGTDRGPVVLRFTAQVTP